MIPVRTPSFRNIFDFSIYLAYIVRKTINLPAEMLHYRELLKTLMRLIQKLQEHLESYILTPIQLDLWHSGLESCKIKIEQIQESLKNLNRSPALWWTMRSRKSALKMLETLEADVTRLTSVEKQFVNHLIPYFG
jgi:hypothetical protein